MDLLKAAVAQRHGVLCEEISKLYWKRFAYKIEVSYHRHDGWKAFFAIVPDLTEVDHRTRREGRRFSVYFVNESDALAYLKVWTGTNYPILIAGPTNSKALAALRGDAKARVRKSLFWGAYRWRVNISWRQARRIPAVRAWLDELTINEGRDASRRCMCASTYPYRVDFRDEADVILFKMMFAELIDTVEVCVLKEELA